MRTPHGRGEVRHPVSMRRLLVLVPIVALLGTTATVASAVEKTGNNRANRIVGTAGSDTLQGKGGNDKLIGKGGADILYGDGGRDRLYGGGGRDTLLGGARNDRLDGGRGRDVISCGAGYDTVITDGRDQIGSDCENVITRS